MKKAFIISILLISITASAQKLVIHAGAGFTRSHSTDAFGKSYLNLTKVTGSVGMQYLNKKFLSLSSSAGYLDDYFTLNTVLKLKSPKPALITPFVNLGLFAGIPLNNVGFKKFNPGPVTGLGFSKKISKHELGIEANYMPFFNKVFEGKSYEGPYTITERSFTVTAFFVF